MHRPARRFVLRAPILPFATLAGIDRARLRALVEQPAVAEAIALAAPDLAHAKGDGVERALLRYVSRMAGRATPFGLFSGVAVGAFGDATRFSIGERHRRLTRLDTDYLARLCARLAEGLRGEVSFVPNTSLHRAGDRMRYVETRFDASGRTLHLVAVDASPYLDAILARAAGGATLAELAGAIDDPELTRGEIAEFVESLVTEQVLHPTLQPPVTGPDPAAAIVAQLRALPSGGPPGAILHDVVTRLAALDAAGAATPADHRAIADALGALPAEVQPTNLLAVDVALDAQIALGARVAGEIARGVELLRRLLPPPRDTWATFRERFAARYEQRAVPLVELLDDESGIGFGTRPADPAPLLDDLPFPASPEPAQLALTPRHAHLVELLARGGLEVELTDADLAILAAPETATIDTFAATVHVVAASPEAVDAGDFRLWIHEVSDRSATRPLGRFCHVSPEIAELTRELARAEERLAPDARFAEIAHLPEGRAGNILVRPVLREHEIAFLGTGGAAHQIGLAELLVSIEGKRVVIRTTGGVEIRPMLATAHNYMSPRSVAIYRFLAAHAGQAAHGGRWSWGALETAPFLPRVRRGKAIVSRARWRLDRAELAGLTTESLAALRARRNLPRWIALADGASELPIDLDSAFAVELLLCDRPTTIAHEHFDPIGTHVHELVVPFVAERAPDVTTARATPPAIARRFPPGSAWLYAKVYGGTADTEDILRDIVAPFVRELGDLAAQFFFIRYADPDPHLRLRFTGDPARLTGELLPSLSARLAAAFDRNQTWRLQLDTYEREIERYGDILAAERVFAADSAACLEIIELTPGADGRDARWRLALRGIDQLLGDLGLDLEARRALVTKLRDAFGAEHGIDATFQRHLGTKYRAHADEIAALLAADADPEHPLAPGLAALARRSRALAGMVASPEIAASHIHMHANRLLPVVARKQELVLYDLLRRHYARATYRFPDRG